MSGLYASLNASVKALSAHGRALETAGRNLANVNNPNYARQRVIYGDRGTVETPDGAESLGLEALGVEQMRDTLLDQQVIRETSLSASFTAEQQGYQRAQAGLGQSIDRTAGSGDATTSTASGLSGAMDDFFNSFQSFAASPTDSGQRQTLLQRAGILTDRFRLTDRNLAQVQSDLNAQVNTDVGNVNRLLSTIADLNSQIGRLEVANPGSAVDLRDQRQAKIEELAGKIPVDVRDAGGGQLQLVVKDSAMNDVVLVDRGTVKGTVSFDGTNVSGGLPPTALGLSSGSIKGALTARDGAIQDLRNSIDLIARQFVSAVNSAYNPSGTAGKDFFTSTGTTAGTISVAAGVTVTSLRAGSSGASGDNDLANAVAAISTKTFSTASGDAIDGTLGSFYTGAVTNLGQSLASANSRVTDQSNIEKLVRSQRDGVSGVSLDEEMADLTRFQRAYQASSRVFSIVDSLLDTVVNSLGR